MPGKESLYHFLYHLLGQCLGWQRNESTNGHVLQSLLKELKEMGQVADFETILSEIVARDEFDSTRQCSPLRQADDALAIDTDNLSIDQVVAEILAVCKSKLS